MTTTTTDTGTKPLPAYHTIMKGGFDLPREQWAIVNWALMQGTGISLATFLRCGCDLMLKQYIREREARGKITPPYVADYLNKVKG